jgi:hypothetical protein
MIFFLFFKKVEVEFIEFVVISNTPVFDFETNDDLCLSLNLFKYSIIDSFGLLKSIPISKPIIYNLSNKNFIII